MCKKKTITTLLVLCFLCAALLIKPVYANQESFNSTTFDDVKGGSWFYSGVKTAYKFGLMDGMGNGKFSPNSNLTLAQAVTIAARMYAVDKNDKINTDQADPWYRPYILYAKEKNLLSTSMQDPGTDYSINATRAQASFLFNQVLSGIESKPNYINTSVIVDINKISAEYQSAVKNMYGMGIITGMPDGTFSGNDNVTRAQISTIISRILDKSERIAYDSKYNNSISGQEGNLAMPLGYLVYDDRYSYHVVTAGSGTQKTNVVKRDSATGRSEVIYKGMGYIDSLCIKNGNLYFIDNSNAAYDTSASTIYMTSHSVIVQYNPADNTVLPYYASDNYSAFGSFAFYGDDMYVTNYYPDADTVKIVKVTKNQGGTVAIDILEFENPYHSIANPFICIFNDRLYYYELKETEQEYDYIAGIIEYNLETKEKKAIVQNDSSAAGFKYIIAGNILYFMDQYDENRTIYKYNLATGESFTKDRKILFANENIENFTVVDGIVYITLYDSNSIYKLLGDQTLASVQDCESHPLNYVMNKGKIYYIQYDIPMEGYFKIQNGSKGQFVWLSEYLNIDPNSYNTAAASLLENPSAYEEFDSSGKMKDLSYSWIYPSNLKWTFDVSLSESLYDKYKKMSRDVGTVYGGLKDYSYFVMDADDDYLMYKFTTYFKEAADEKNFDKNELIQFIACFVQGLEYVSDKVGTGYDEYEKFPVETLYDQGGDCEDSSILLASFLKEMDIDCAMLLFPGHMAVGVACDEIKNGSYCNYEGKKYYYIETTDSGWRLGEIPEELNDETAILIPIE
jgi:S-layer homology domain.